MDNLAQELYEKIIKRLEAEIEDCREANVELKRELWLAFQTIDGLEKLGLDLAENNKPKWKEAFEAKRNAALEALTKVRYLYPQKK